MLFSRRLSSMLYIVLYRFSCADISVVVRDAMMTPVRKVQMSTHFRKVQYNYGAFLFNNFANVFTEFHLLPKCL